MIEPDLVDDNPVRLDAEIACPPALKADRDVAEPDRLVVVVEQRTGDDADGVGEVDDPRVVGQLAHTLRDLEDDRHRPERLREAAGAGRLLADAAARERRRLVDETGGLAADPDLDQHEVGAVDGAIEILGHVERAEVPLPREHPLRQAADYFAALGVDVVQDERVDVETGEPRDELGSVGRAATDDSHLHPFTPVSVTPSTNARCARKNRMITGAITSTVAAIVRFHCTWCSERNCARPIESTQLSGFSPTYSSGRKKSLNV